MDCAFWFELLFQLCTAQIVKGTYFFVLYICLFTWDIAFKNSLISLWALPASRASLGCFLLGGNINTCQVRSEGSHLTPCCLWEGTPTLWNWTRHHIFLAKEMPCTTDGPHNRPTWSSQNIAENSTPYLAYRILSQNPRPRASITSLVINLTLDRGPLLEAHLQFSSANLCFQYVMNILEKKKNKENWRVLLI